MNRSSCAMRTLALLAALTITACDSPAALAPTAAPPPTAVATSTPTVVPSPIPTAAPLPTAAVEQRSETAPGQPIASDTWTAGAKLGVGTAFTYDQPPGDANPSRVW
ncbi:MAG TPA: hypothetical protein VFO07_15635, partial [Roseiflexaceae bacterium]|nr:hypothetical protein [Roseiflexaceae bacterium]